MSCSAREGLKKLICNYVFLVNVISILRAIMCHLLEKAKRGIKEPAEERKLKERNSGG